MKLKWFGHACFQVESGGYRIVLDPYADGSVPGLKPLFLQAHQVLCSHDHRDHNAAHVVRMLEGGTSPFAITTVSSAHDDQGGALRGMNTIHILEAEDVRVAHLGDLGTMLTAEQAKQIGRLDALILPIGGRYTIDANQAFEVAEMLSPTVTIPVHYRSARFGFDELGRIDAFTKLYDEGVRELPTNSITITPDMPKQVAVLQCRCML